MLKENIADGNETRDIEEVVINVSKISNKTAVLKKFLKFLRKI